MKITPSMDRLELAKAIPTNDMIAVDFIIEMLRPYIGMDTKDLGIEWWYIVHEAHEKASDERLAEYLSQATNKAKGA